MRAESGGYRRDHLRALAQRVEVGAKEVRIMGSKGALVRTLVASGPDSPAAAPASNFRQSPSLVEILCATRIMRVFYNEYAGGDGSLRRLVNRLAELDLIDYATARLRETKRGWKVLASAA